MTAAPDLVVEGITVTFGGLVAVDDVSLVAQGGSITGLIGPNGAGKSTTFNACTGVVPTRSGTVHLGDACLDGASPHRRAQLGLGRTFQRMELFDSLTVLENVTLGPEALAAGRRPWSQLRASRVGRADILERAADALRRCNVDALADKPAGELSTGQRRLVELARVLASPFSFLLLDEPSSGLDRSETERFGEVLEEAVDRTKIGVLLVEHDMALVRASCRHIYVLDFGKLIFAGPAAETLASDAVRTAYLGTEAVT